MLSRVPELDDVLDSPLIIKTKDGKELIVQQPSLGVVREIENLKTQIMKSEAGVVQVLMSLGDKANVDVKDLQNKLAEVTAKALEKKFDILVSIVQWLLEGGKPDKTFTYSREFIENNIPVTELRKAIKFYNESVDLEGFFTDLIGQKKEQKKENQQTGENS